MLEFWIKIVGFLLESQFFPSRNYVFQNIQQLYSIHIYPAIHGNIFSNKMFNCNYLIFYEMHFYDMLLQQCQFCLDLKNQIKSVGMCFAKKIKSAIYP